MIQEASGESTRGGQFIAALEWSIDGGKDYTWPFESIKQAHYKAVWMSVEQMPRAWSEQSKSRKSTSLSAYRALWVNGRQLPKPDRVTGKREEFRVYLDRGRLRFSFNLPSGFKLDTQNAIVKIRLYESE